MISMSESIDHLACALAAFHRECPKVFKHAANPYFKSRYADLADILEVVTPHLAKNDLSIVQVPSGDDDLVTMLVHASGQYFKTVSKMRPVASVVRRRDDGTEVSEVTPQALGSAITYQRRYSVAAILSLCIDDDDDGNAASGRSTKPVAKPVASQKPEPIPSDRIAEIPAKIQSAEISQMQSMNTTLANWGAAGKITKEVWSDFTHKLLMRWIAIAPIAKISEPADLVSIYRSRGVLNNEQHDQLVEAIVCATNEGMKE